MANVQPVSDLHIKDLVDISSMLKSIIAPSFGPQCQPVLITTNTGQVVFTKDGFTVLSSLSLAHPVAKCILENVFSHSSVYGDGSKTVILYLSELFREIERNLSKLLGLTEKNCLRSKISTSLHKFVVEDLSVLCNNLVNFAVGDQISADGINSQLKLLKQVTQTTLNGSFSEDVVDHFGCLISNFIYSLDLDEEIRDVVKASFQNCVHVFPNKSYMDSHLSDGLFFHGLASHQSMRCETKAKFVILLCPLEEEATDSKTDYFVQVTSEKVHGSIMTHKKDLVNFFANNLKKLDVSLIITSHRVPDFALRICKSKCVDIFSCVEQEDIDFISYFTGISPITSVQDELDTNDLIVGEVDSYEKVLYSGKEMVKLVCTGQFSSWLTKSLFLHAPTDGLAHQLKLLIKKCFKALSCLLEGFSHKRSQPHSAGFIQQDPSSVQNERPLQTFYKSPSENEGQGLERPRRHSIYSNSICGGGYFEFLLCYMMEKKFDKSCQAETKIWADIVMKMLQTIPQTLFSNLNSSRASNISGFISIKGEVQKNLADHAAVGFTSNGVLSNAVNSGVVDILSVKQASLFSALDLAVVLLKIDAVVGVKKLPQDLNKDGT